MREWLEEEKSKLESRLKTFDLDTVHVSDFEIQGKYLLEGRLLQLNETLKYLEKTGWTTQDS